MKRIIRKPSLSLVYFYLIVWVSFIFDERIKAYFFARKIPNTTAQMWFEIGYYSVFVLFGVLLWSLIEYTGYKYEKKEQPRYIKVGELIGMFLTISLGTVLSYSGQFRNYLDGFGISNPTTQSSTAFFAASLFGLLIFFLVEKILKYESNTTIG